MVSGVFLMEQAASLAELEELLDEPELEQDLALLVSISGAGYPEQRHDLHFEGDPRITERHAERSRQHGRFGDVRPLERNEEGVLQCVRDIRLHD